MRSIVLVFAIILFVSCTNSETSAEGQKEDKTENSENTSDAKPEEKIDSTKQIAYNFVRAFGDFFENDKDSFKQKRIDDDLYKKLNPTPSLSNQEVRSTVVSSKKKLIINKEIFGFHPHWANEIQNDYNYDILTTLSYFAYEIDPITGNLKDIGEGKDVKIIDAALKGDVKVYLTITNLTKQANIDFLTNSIAQNASIDAISELLKKHDVHGVTIDFEMVEPWLEENYTSYITTLFNRLNPEGKQIAIALPGNSSIAFNITDLNPFVDYFIIMGKNYFYNKSKYAGPVAPLNNIDIPNNPGSLVKSIDDYLVQEKMPREKLILSLPYYGFHWQTKSNDIFAESEKLIEMLSYDQIQNSYKHMDRKYEPVSQSAYYKYVDNGEYYQVWFDDSTTLAKKYDLINKNELAGVGIWALSFAGKNDELWEVLEDKFSVENKEEQRLQPSDLLKGELSWLDVFKNIGALKGFLSLASLVFILGFILSLRKGEIRAIVFQNSILKNIVLFGLPFLLAFCVYYYFNKNTTWAVVTFACILIGYGLYYLLIRTERDFKNLNRIP